MQVCIAVYIKPLAVGTNSWLRAFWRMYFLDPQGRFSVLFYGSVNLPFTLAYILFLSVRTECREGSQHPRMFILFCAAEKERTKKKAAARNSHSFENACHG